MSDPKVISQTRHIATGDKPTESVSAWLLENGNVAILIDDDPFEFSAKFACAAASAIAMAGNDAKRHAAPPAVTPTDATVAPNPISGTWGKA